MFTKHGSIKRADEPSVREREKFPVQRAGGGGLVQWLSLGLVEWVTGLLRGLAKNQVSTKSWRFAMLLLTVVSITAGSQSAWAYIVESPGGGDNNYKWWWDSRWWRR